MYDQIYINLMVQLIFQHSIHRSHNPSEIILICWFGAQETFSGFFDEQKFQKSSIYLKLNYKCLYCDFSIDFYLNIH